MKHQLPHGVKIDDKRDIGLGLCIDDSDFRFLRLDYLKKMDKCVFFTRTIAMSLLQIDNLTQLQIEANRMKEVIAEANRLIND